MVRVLSTRTFSWRSKRTIWPYWHTNDTLTHSRNRSLIWGEAVEWADNSIFKFTRVVPTELEQKTWAWWTGGNGLGAGQRALITGQLLAFSEIRSQIYIQSGKSEDCEGRVCTSGTINMGNVTGLMECSQTSALHRRGDLPTPTKHYIAPPPAPAFFSWHPPTHTPYWQFTIHTSTLMW